MFKGVKIIFYKKMNLIIHQNFKQYKRNTSVYISLCLLIRISSPLSADRHPPLAPALRPEASDTRPPDPLVPLPTRTRTAISWVVNATNCLAPFKLLDFHFALSSLVNHLIICLRKMKHQKSNILKIH